MSYENDKESYLRRRAIKPKKAEKNPTVNLITLHHENAFNYNYKIGCNYVNKSNFIILHQIKYNIMK